jgi:hypothetical protein
VAVFDYCSAFAPSHPTVLSIHYNTNSTMTMEASVSSSSSSSLHRAESGTRNKNKKKNRGIVFDASASASEDDPLLQEPLLLPTNVQQLMPDLYTHDKQEQAPPSSRNHDFRVFSNTTENTKKKRATTMIRYESDSHIRVLFQMYGSVWPAVLPYCIVSVTITALIAYLHQSKHIVDLTFASSTGHSFMAIMYEDVATM